MEKGLELVLDDDSKYVVVDSFEIDGKEYAYLNKRFDYKKNCLVRIDGDTMHKIDDSEFSAILAELVKRNKEEIIEHLKEY